MSCQGRIGELGTRPSPTPTADGAVADSASDVFDPSLPAYAPGELTFPRLTNTQYRNATVDLFGPGLAPVELEADTNPFLFTTIGASRATLSARGVQQYERAALSLTETVFADSARRQALLGCTPTAVTDACVRTFFERFGRQAFRRPLDTEELDRFVSVARATTNAGDVWTGLRYAVATILQSPSFLYRVELGEEVGGRRKYTSYEMASRLAFTLWASLPDQALLDAAGRNALSTDDQVRVEAERMMRSPRARAGVRSFFVQYLGLSALDNLSRDVADFPRISATMGASMRQEIELLVEDMIFTQDTDFRQLFSARQTFVNSELAGLYGIPYPAGASGFVRVALPESSQRGGLLTTGAILSLTSHQNASSPTARGRFVVERLRCEPVPDPPGNIQFDLAQPTSGPRLTLRERLARHRANPACAACHEITDPLGLGFENFDALGALRTTEEGAAIDASGVIDGTPFVGARALSAALANDPRVARCLIRQTWRYAQGRLDAEGEQRGLIQLTQRFGEQGYRFKLLLVDLVSSEGFRFAAPPTP